ncbi:aspartyl-phosphate phosphatase Spo0E family protein [Paenibacillus kribbensis]|uniref:aspartyl-phosphate phosphatase Spo0E family protein n=1 Tax=Paenibacillus kribbensis TaxID=172713 RepID=UPI0008390BA0|nr:aspartyl-phosphate phosphatase Spo0E family protein [Paenibacillus kribbensis]
METYETLHHQLENARQQLYDLYNQYGFGHTTVLEQSMLLDELINQYNRIFQPSLCKTNPPNE